MHNVVRRRGQSSELIGEGFHRDAVTLENIRKRCGQINGKPVEVVEIGFRIKREGFEGFVNPGCDFVQQKIRAEIIAENGSIGICGKQGRHRTAQSHHGTDEAAARACPDDDHSGQKNDCVNGKTHG